MITSPLFDLFGRSPLFSANLNPHLPTCPTGVVVFSVNVVKPWWWWHCRKTKPQREKVWDCQICQAIGQKKTYPETKSSAIFAKQKHCSDIQQFIGVDSATHKIQHGIQKGRSKMLQTQNQVQNLNQRLLATKKTWFACAPPVFFLSKETHYWLLQALGGTQCMYIYILQLYSCMCMCIMYAHGSVF